MKTPSRKVQCTCPVCGKVFEKFPSLLVGKVQVYCSRTCKYEGTKTKTEVECAQCGKSVSKFVCEVRDNSTHYCSATCYNSSRRKHIKSTTYVKLNGRHEHRVVAEKLLGRALLSREVVHHIDENKHNNAPENLAILPNQRLHAIVHSTPDFDLEPYKLLNLSNGNISRISRK
ncbi:hypothetical protein DYU11_11655 [Fibrisoma montanum]|uniref:HNH nuclease domain-containing protein n=1 Tax=Fibrisoma montanum TaxID=2305895 RepID=A0A418MBA9_9BACT|nr:hypothetical protein DYU11_11655 [Fibrisoma montanum]